MKDTLINNFLRISSIPRKSGNEKQISDFFVDVAKKNNLEYYQDENYNVLIKKKGNITGETIAFQAHLDMVCVKEKDSNHDFSKDGIDVIIDGDKVTAKDTSLGADQGVGLTLMLTLIESTNVNHPNLEFLFTVEEETTYKGAITFPYDKVNSKKMINIDYSQDNAIVVASAGDIVNEYLYDIKYDKRNLPSYKLSLEGLPGGNSGENIKESESNAIITLVKLLVGKEVYLKSINGGTFENDVATNCEIVLQTTLDLINYFKDTNVKVETIENNESISIDATNNIFSEIVNLKSGVITNTASGNLGMIKTIDNKVIITYLLRSIDNDELENTITSINNLEYGFKVNKIYDDDIWTIKENSYLYQNYKETYYKLFNEYPIDIVGQGGLEIASIQKRIEGLDIISIGANMDNIHSTKETTYISSWIKVYDILINMIKN